MRSSSGFYITGKVIRGVVNDQSIYNIILNIFLLSISLFTRLTLIYSFIVHFLPILPTYAKLLLLILIVL